MLIFDDGQVRDVVTKLRKRVLYARAITALFPGLRRGKVLTLRWRNSDIDAARGIRVREALDKAAAINAALAGLCQT